VEADKEAGSVLGSDASWFSHYAGIYGFNELTGAASMSAVDMAKPCCKTLWTTSQLTTKSNPMFYRFVMIPPGYFGTPYIAAFLTEPMTTNSSLTQASLYVWNPANGTLLLKQVLYAPGAALQAAFDWTGGNIAFYSALTGTAVVDVWSLTSSHGKVSFGKHKLHTLVDFDGSSFCFAFDGSSVTVGFQTTYVYALNATDGYSLVGTYNAPTNFYNSACVSNGTVIVLGFTAFNYLDVAVASFALESTITLQYLWKSPIETGGIYQDVVSSMAMWDKFVAVGSWGQANSTHTIPTVRLFDVTNAKAPVVWSATTPGSVFSVDIAPGPQGVLVAACGKHVPANQFGDGGDLMLWSITTE